MRLFTKLSRLLMRSWSAIFHVVWNLQLKILQDWSEWESCSPNISTTQQLSSRSCKYLLHHCSNSSDTTHRLPNKMVLPLTNHWNLITSQCFLDHLHTQTLALWISLLLATLLSILCICFSIHFITCLTHPYPEPNCSCYLSLPTVTLPHLSSSQSSHPDHSNPYPSVENFISALKAQHPQHNLEHFTLYLTGADYYHVNDLAKLDQQFFESTEVGMTTGNASFLLMRWQRSWIQRRLEQLTLLQIGDEEWVQFTWWFLVCSASLTVVSL